MTREGKPGKRAKRESIVLPEPMSFTREEAEEMGAFVEDALSLEDAEAAQWKCSDDYIAAEQRKSGQKEGK